MNILSDIYHKKLAENEKYIHFWEDYLNSLKALDFNIFGDKLKVPALIPIGSRIFFRGELKHTNAVTVALGADYFAKCSLQQAEVLRKHRMKDAQFKLDSFKKEREYLKNHMSFSRHSIYEDSGEEIIEEYNEKEDKLWREKHRENIRQHKQKKHSEESASIIEDNELWSRLEELELQEELDNELQNFKNDNIATDTEKEYFVIKEENSHCIDTKVNNKEEKKVKFKTPEQTSKLDLLQQVIEKQNELKEQLFELKNRDRIQSKTEKDLLSKLDEMDHLDELEDEMDRLDDVLENRDEEVEEENDNNSSKTPTKLKSVSFADEDDSETLEITFKHSEVEQSSEPYDPQKGILKPSDIYTAYPKLFVGETTSILKESKYKEIETVADDKDNFKIHEKQNENYLTEAKGIDRNIVVKDVMEKVTWEDKKLEVDSRPVSLFKKRKQQQKML